MSNEESVRLAQRAKLILEDDLVRDALQQLETAVVDQWKELSIENRAQAEELKRLLWASQQFRRIFEVLVSGGVVAQNELLLESQLKIKQEAARERMRNYG